MCCVFSEFGRFKISLDLVCSGVSFLTGKEAEMKSGYLPGLFELTWLVFGETLKISGTEPAFLSKQGIPNLGFFWETKAVQRSTATRTALGWSIFPGCLKPDDLFCVLEEVEVKERV